jgi:hypothetical protein
MDADNDSFSEEGEFNFFDPTPPICLESKEETMCDTKDCLLEQVFTLFH